MKRFHKIQRWCASLAALALMIAILVGPSIDRAATGGAVLTGAVKSASGEKMGGVTVSAKIPGEPITTSVFTDDQGNFYFPPMEDGKYRVWAQAVGFEKVQNDVALQGTVQHDDFVMKPAKDIFSQLSGAELAAALPEDTPAHRRMKYEFLRDCTECHSASVPLQNKFDEQGWEAMIDAMSRIGQFGAFRKADQQPSRTITYFKKDLATYLAEMRGPGPSPMQLTIPQRPSGEATMPVIYEYDVAIDGNGGYTLNNGADWSVGPTVGAGGSLGIHDAQVDWNGNLWFTNMQTGSADRTVGRIDGKTGQVTDIKYPGENGYAATSHGMVLSHDGMVYFNVNQGNNLSGGLGRIDPKTAKPEMFTQEGMPRITIQVDEDGQGQIWGSTTKGALRFDPKTKVLTEFKSVTPGGTYGVTGDREGNGWWNQIGLDIIGHSDIETGKSMEIRETPASTFLKDGDMSPDDLKVYGPRGVGAQAPRRNGADLNGDDVWSPDFIGQTLFRANIHTFKTTYYTSPIPFVNPYEAVVDHNHNVWMNLQNTDQFAKFDPSNEKWTFYNLPSRGTGTRSLRILDRDGVLQLSTAYIDGNRAVRMVIRTDKDIQALKAKAH